MSIAPDQLGEIYRQISERFISHPLISVEPTQGDPPDQYCITYKISGLTQTDNGDIVEATEHTIELSIPFGFPHFPPSCRPKTIIFHPDFDPGAICIGDYWEQNPSLVDLIIQIGQMLNGESYSSQDAFNDKAASWYEKNSSKFPLAAISWDQTAPPEEESFEDPDLDNLDLGEFNFEDDESLTLETEESPEDDFSELFPSIDLDIDSKDEVDVSSFEHLQARKEYFTLRKTLEGQTEFSVELQAVLDDTESIIEDATRFYNEAKELEKVGNASKALEQYKSVALMVRDYPAIHSDIKRLEQTLDLVDDLIPHELSDALMESITEEPPLSPIPIEEVEAEPEPIKQEPIQPKPAKSVLSTPQKRSFNKLFIVVPVGVILLATLVVYSLSFLANRNLGKALRSQDLCAEAMEVGDFQSAKTHCESGMENAGKVWVFHRDKAAEVSSSITQIMQSEKFKNGLEGRILISGRYVSKKEAILIQDLKTKTDSAETLYYQNRFVDAAIAFTEALQIAKNIDSADPSLTEELELNKRVSLFRQSLLSAENLVAEKKWKKALGKITESKNRLMELPEDLHSEFEDKIQEITTLSNFELAIVEGDNSVYNGNWTLAILSYNRSLDYALKIPNLQKARITEVESGIARAKLYQTLESGNKAFAQGDWDTAIAAYKQANKTLIASKYAPVDDVKSSLSRKKLNKIILQASIIRDQQSIKSMLSNDELRGARETYKNILTLIESSNLAEENEFAKAKADIKAELVSLEQKIYLTDKQSYLLDNYQDLFGAVYQNSEKEKLTAPVVKLVKETPNSLVFRMQCTETRGGRPLTLILFYTYDKVKNTWSQTSGS